MEQDDEHYIGETLAGREGSFPAVQWRQNSRYHDALLIHIKNIEKQKLNDERILGIRAQLADVANCHRPGE